MSETTSHQTDKVHIAREAGVCGGKPCVAGTRIRVQDIYVWNELQGKGPDEIVRDFPQLTLADVYAALAYLWDRREEILSEMRVEDETLAKIRAANPSKLPPRGQLAVSNAVSS